jgi:hypothetical protein
MAFHYCEIMVINITICWNGAYLLITFNSLNINILSQSAGNLDKYLFILEGSSETTRDDTYDLFKRHYKNIYRNAPPSFRGRGNHLNND